MQAARYLKESELASYGVHTPIVEAWYPVPTNAIWKTMSAAWHHRNHFSRARSPAKYGLWADECWINCNLPEHGQSSVACDQFPARRFPDRPSKLELTLNALQSALTALSDTGRVQVVVSAFPEQASSCTVTSEPAIPLTALDSKTVGNVTQRLVSLEPYGTTPLVGATIFGYQYILNQVRQIP